jgi:DNA-binding NarL/FixJ family response regulator
MINKPVRVMIIDDHQLIIDGLKSILEDEEDVLFAGGANTSDTAMEFINSNPIDVVLADINMPGKSGIDFTRELKKLHPHIHVLALTMHEDISMIRLMVEAGASGYILKRTNMNEVLEAIKVVAANGKYLGRDVQAVMLDSFKTNENVKVIAEDLPGTLTPRELEILNLVAREMSNVEIANKLFISERTVETHRRNIFTKTKTKSIVGLIKYAIREGLIPQEVND